MSAYFEGPWNESQMLSNVMQLNGQYYLYHMILMKQKVGGELMSQL